MTLVPSPESLLPTQEWHGDNYVRQLRENKPSWGQLHTTQLPDGRLNVELRVNPITTPPDSYKDSDNYHLVELYEDAAMLSNLAGTGLGNYLQEFGYEFSKADEKGVQSIVLPSKATAAGAATRLPDNLRGSVKLFFGDEHETTSERMLQNFDNGLYEISGDFPLKEHDLITHAPVFLLLPKTTIARITATGHAHRNAALKDPEDTAAAKAYDAFFNRVEWIVNSDLFFETIEHLRNRPKAVANTLLGQYWEICGFNDEVDGYIKAKDEVSSIMERVIFLDAQYSGSHKARRIARTALQTT